MARMDGMDDDSDATAGMDGAECISADNTITHRNLKGEIITETFIGDLDKDVVMGVTSGASTPDAGVQDSLSQIFLLKKMHDSAKSGESS